ncbi:DUF4380 domain-containing protein [Saccharopolyspora sp. NFXS83]|uniref:DUF4380 domain-containing protein n=1 Tax=Saccharopolyspora sp. NFXS83 TaxID=2993560 RepID=UPI00224B2F29|nr:DUF4380 domain-containing protein [Saccharopolyspora sp. NFXS83]MCX2730620.1 DUF4380 domain-containing protein [Saccharopolyspora sp. NFXS83]
MSREHRARAVRRRVGGHTVIDLGNERLALVLAPELGGRILSLRLDGREFLHRSPELLDDHCGARDPATVAAHGGRMQDWRNWGGDKTWPAPQGWSGPQEWAGPPDPVLDSGEYEARIEHDPDGDSARVVLTSAPDPRTGLRLRRDISLSAGRTDYRLRLTATNTTDGPVRWAIWNVAQLPGHPSERDGDGVWIGLDGEPGYGPASTPLVAGTGNPRVEQPRPGVAHVPTQDVVGKVGFPAASGWIAHTGPAGTWVHRFPVDRDATYPDGGSRAEVWLEHPLTEPLGHLGGLRPAHRIVECEVLGPLVELEPGASTELATSVVLGPHGGEVTAVGASGWWNEPLRALSVGDGTRLTGRFVPCADNATPIGIRVVADGTELTTHRTEIPVRAGEPVELDDLAPLRAVPRGSVIEVLSDDFAEQPAGRIELP